MGSASAPDRVFCNDGPIARMTTFFGSLPVMMNPPIIALSPDSTRPRVAMLSGWDGGAALGDAVATGVALWVTVADGVEEGVVAGGAVAVAGGVGVGVGEVVGAGGGGVVW